MRKLLEVKNLSVSFKMVNKDLNYSFQESIKDMSISVEAGKIHAIVGSSGSGKSLLAHAILNILPKNAIVKGDMYFKGELLNDSNLKKIRKDEIAFIPQSVSYLNPLIKTKRYFNYDSEELKKLVENNYFGLTTKDIEKYTFELSGGMARRALVAAAIFRKGSLIIADEPTPGLNNELAMEILKSLHLEAQNGKGVLIITHDIDMVLDVADTMSIFNNGKILETIDIQDFIAGPSKIKHPYTKGLWSVLPQNGFENVNLERVKQECIELNLEY